MAANCAASPAAASRWARRWSARASRAGMARGGGGGAEAWSGPDGVWKVSRKLVQCGGRGRRVDYAELGAVSPRLDAAVMAPRILPVGRKDLSNVKRCRTAEIAPLFRTGVGAADTTQLRHPGLVPGSTARHIKR
ncbi:hypothetical protein SPHINGOAX6_30306 [Sphingomonas sp. AX6]|nr:hypothetical protein SPHINGOAX6_30306 [Sphingomonas sp. AX6]